MCCCGGAAVHVGAGVFVCYGKVTIHTTGKTCTYCTKVFVRFRSAVQSAVTQNMMHRILAAYFAVGRSVVQISIGLLQVRASLPTITMKARLLCGMRWTEINPKVKHCLKLRLENGTDRAAVCQLQGKLRSRSSCASYCSVQAAQCSK